MKEDKREREGERARGKRKMSRYTGGTKVLVMVGKELMHAKEGQRKREARREGKTVEEKKDEGGRGGAREGRVRVVYGRRINRRETI